jgi:hypothetical protein
MTEASRRLNSFRNTLGPGICYLLKSCCNYLSAQDIWRTYLLLTRVEAAFCAMNLPPFGAAVGLNASEGSGFRPLVLNCRIQERRLQSTRKPCYQFTRTFSKERPPLRAPVFN